MELPEKTEREVGPVAMPSDAAVGAGCFDCNICLDFSRDPVVTLCGHLYCWPCIYKWLTTQQWCPVCKATLSQAALVPLYGRGVAVKASESGIGIPDRPSATCIAHPLEATSPLALAEPPPQPTNNHDTSSQGSQQHYHYHHHHHQYYPLYNQHLSSNFAGGSVTGHAIHRRAGGIVYALLPWVIGLVFGCPQPLLYHSDPYYLNGNDSGGPIVGRWQRERQAEMSLSRVSVFLLCCLVLCLFLF